MIVQLTSWPSEPRRPWSMLIKLLYPSPRTCPDHALVINPRAWKGFSQKFGGQIAKAFSLHSMLEWLAVERVRICLREAGWKGDKKHEFEPVRASRGILRCPQRGQPPARRDVRWS